MKIFLSYKQTGVSDQELIEKLTMIRETLSELGHETFIYYFDANYSEQTPKEVIEYAKQKITESDIVLSFINYEGKSEGMMEELGIAFGLDKKIMVLLKDEFKDEYYLSYGLSDNTVLFSDFSEVPELLTKNFSQGNQL